LLRKKFRLLFILALLCFSQQAVASHSMGSDLTYECLGNNQYLIRLSFYRDCLGVPAGSFAFVDVNSSCFPAGYIILDPIPGTGQEITPICSTEVTTCSGGTYTGIQEYIYEAVVTLPGPCADWTFSYDLCCRNAAITTIVDPDLQNIFVQATLNNVVAPCNSSPVFSNRPVPFVCVGQEFCFNHGAYDVDGDSLVYQLITPFNTGGASTVTYLPGYNAQNPLLSNPPMNFNAATGDFCVTPTQLEVTVMAVLVSEYRNGVLIGSVERDIQITVINCSNIIPELSGINGTGNFSASVCANQQLCFSITSSDQDAVQNTQIFWDQSIPGATFSVSPGNRENGTFCWTPPLSAISTVPYCFTVTVLDDNCPYAGTQTYSYCITVQGAEVNAGSDVFLGCSSSGATTTTLTATATGGSGIYNYQWSTGATTPSISAGPGTYVVTVNNSGCVTRDTVVVSAGGTTPVATFTASTSCSGTAAVFNNQSSIAGGNISGVSWSFGDGTTSTQNNPTHTYPGPGNYTVTLVVTAGSCADTLVQQVTLAPDQPVAAFTAANVCLGESVQFNNQSTSTSNIVSWNWDLGNGMSSLSASPAYTYTNPGTYAVSLTVTNAAGCTSSITRNVIVRPLPVSDAGDDVVICEGSGTTLTASGGGTYQWSPSGSTAATWNVSPTQSTDYIVTVANNWGCEDSDTVSVVVQPLPVLNLGPVVPICEGATATISAGTSSTLDYSWSPGGMTTAQITVSPSQNTNYFVVATDTIGCSSSASVSVVINPIPQAILSTTDVSCNGGSNGMAVVNPVGGTAPYTYNWQPGGATTASVSTFAAGNYSVVLTDDNGCSDTFFTSIGEPTSIVTQVTAVAASCNTYADGAVSVVASGGISGYTYAWVPSSSTSDSVNNLTAGLYSVTVTDANGCTQTNSVTVNEPPPLSLTITPQPALCFGSADGSLSAQAGGGLGGFVFSWNGLSAITSVVNNLVAGSYSLVVTDLNGCTIAGSAQITEPAVLSLSISTTPATCGVADGTAAALAQGGMPGYQYLWTPGGANSANPSNLPAGSYDVLVTDNNGCTITGFANIPNTGSPVVSAAVIGNVSCFNGNDGVAQVQIVSGNGPFTYSWGNGQQTDTAVNLSFGIFPVEVTDVNGCVALDTVSILQPSLLVIAASASPVTCYGATNGSAAVTVSGGVQGYTYSWSVAGQTGRTISGLGAGSYTATVTDANGCTAAITSVISTPSPLTLSYTSTPVLCNGTSSGSAIVTASGSNGNYQFIWPDGNTGDSISGLSAGIYPVTVTDSAGCTEVISVLVTEPSLLQLSATDGGVSCSGSSDGAVSAVAVGGSPAYQYLWQPGGATTAVANGLLAGTYTVIATDANGCTTQSVATVSDPAPVSLQTTIPPIICIGQSALLTAGAAGGTAPFSFSWSQGAQGDSVVVSPDTTSLFSVVVTDVNGCSTAPQQVLVEVYPPLAVVVDNLPVICGGDSALLLAFAAGGNGGPYAYSWNDGAILSNQSVIQPTDDSLFVVTVDDGCSPPVVATVAIDVHPLPVVQFTPQQISGCTPVQVDFQNLVAVPPGSQYDWDLDDQAVSTDSIAGHTYTIPGTYDISLTITTPQGCTATQTVQEVVEVFGYPQAGFQQSDEIVSSLAANVSFYDVSLDAISWSWDFGDGTAVFGEPNPVHLFSDSGTYTVSLIVASTGGCLDTITGIVRVEPESSIFIPNAFTPNGDGRNDGFIALGVNIINYQMWILDRWGLPIFHSVSFDHPWNGTYMDNDRPCQNDVYEYIIEATDIKGRLNRYIGHVTLVR